jgi:hypothetical protein
LMKMRSWRNTNHWLRKQSIWGWRYCFYFFSFFYCCYSLIVCIILRNFELGWFGTNLLFWLPSSYSSPGIGRLECVGWDEI